MTPLSRRLILLLILIAAYALAYNGDIDGDLDFFHEGDRLAHMDKLWSGGLPFRDIYVQQGLGENILKPALACKIWGRSVASLRRLGQNTSIYRGYLPPLGLVATLVAIYALTQSLVALAISALVLLTCWYEITERHALGMLAVACAGFHLHSRKTYWLALSGLLCTLGALYSLEVGLYCGAAIIVWLALGALGAHVQSWRGLFRTLGFFALGAGPPLLIFLMWCAFHGILKDFFYNVYWQLVMRSAVIPSAYPMPDFGAGHWMFARQIVLFYLLPITVLGWAMVLMLRMRRNQAVQTSAALLAALVAAAFWVSVWSRPDIWHVAFVAGPFVVFGAALLYAQRKRSRAEGLLVISICIFGLLAIANGGAIARKINSPDRWKRALVKCHNPRLGEVRIGAAHCGFVTAISGYIHLHARPDETMLDLSDFGLIYFLAARQGPTRFHLISHVGHSSLRSLMATEVLSHRPAVVIRRDEPLRPGDPLDDLVARYYVPDAEIGSLRLFLRAETK